MVACIEHVLLSYSSLYICHKTGIFYFVTKSCIFLNIKIKITILTHLYGYYFLATQML